MPYSKGPRPRLQAPTASVMRAAARMLSSFMKRKTIGRRKRKSTLAAWKSHKRSVNKSLFASTAKHPWSKFKVKSKHQFRRFY